MSFMQGGPFSTRLLSIGALHDLGLDCTTCMIHVYTNEQRKTHVLIGLEECDRRT